MSTIIKILGVLGIFNIIGALAQEDHFFVQKISFEDRIKILEDMGKYCEVKADAAMLRDILEFKAGVSRDTKCYLRCLVEFFDLHVDDAHHVHVDRIMEFAVALYPDNYEHVRVFINDCNVEIGKIDDKCEAAYGHAQCMHRKLTDSGIGIPDFEG